MQPNGLSLVLWANAEGNLPPLNPLENLPCFLYKLPVFNPLSSFGCQEFTVGKSQRAEHFFMFYFFFQGGNECHKEVAAPVPGLPHALHSSPVEVSVQCSSGDCKHLAEGHGQREMQVNS